MADPKDSTNKNAHGSRTYVMEKDNNGLAQFNNFGLYSKGDYNNSPGLYGTPGGGNGGMYANFINNYKAAASGIAKKAQASNGQEAATVKPQVQQGPIHAIIRSCIANLEREIKEEIPWYIRYSDKVAPHGLPLKFLYRVRQYLMLGFYQYLDTLTEEDIKKKFEHFITAPFSISYAVGQLEGEAEGIAQWVVDTVTIVGDVIKLPGTIRAYVATSMTADLATAYQKADAAVQWIKQNPKTVLSFVAKLYTDSTGEVEQMKAGMEKQIYATAQGMGQTMGRKLYEFAGSSNKEMGETYGKVIGYLIPEVLLAVFTDAIANAFKDVAEAVRAIIKAGSLAVEEAAGSIRLAKIAIETIAEFIEKSKIFIGEKYKGLQKALKDIVDFIKKWLGIEEKEAEVAKAPLTVMSKADSKVLGENLEKAGFKRPPDAAAHHIVAGDAPNAKQARQILQREGIDINDADNGVFLPKNTKYAQPPAITHSVIHTNQYYAEINTRLINARPGKVRMELQAIRNEILNGTFPYK